MGKTKNGVNMLYASGQRYHVCSLPVLWSAAIRWSLQALSIILEGSCLGIVWGFFRAFILCTNSMPFTCCFFLQSWCTDKLEAFKNVFFSMMLHSESLSE